MQPTADSATGFLDDGSVSPFWFALALLVAVCIAYLPVFGAGFVWDDDLHLLNNAVLQENGLYRVWVLREAWIYYPVTFTSYWAEYQIWGLHPAGYHTVNVALHAISALLLWHILLHLRFAPFVAMFAAMLFALHPQNVESVAWITQRKNTLSMLFFMLTIHAYLRFDASRDEPPVVRGPSASRVGRLWYFSALLAFVLGMLSKGAIVPLPFVLLLALAWRRGFGEPGIPTAATVESRPRHSGAREAWRRPIRRADLLAISVFLLPALGLTLHDVLREQIWLSGDIARDDSLWSRLSGSGWNAWFYAWKTFVPWQLSFVYPRWTIDPGRVSSWIPTAASLLSLAGALVLWRRGGAFARAGRAVSFTLVYYALMIAPSLGFVNFYYMRYSFVADHYQYYAQLGLVVLFAGTLAELPRPAPRVRWAAACAVLLALGLLTYRQCLAYQDEETLWRDTLVKNPNASLALNNLAAILARRGEHDEALALLLRATLTDPSNREAWRNAGIIQGIQGQPESALESFRQAITHWPGGAGLSQQEVGELTLAGAHVRLGLVQMSIGQVNRAEYHYREALALEPGNARARVGIGNTLLLHGAVQAAVSSYRASLVIDPAAVEPMEMLTRIYASFPQSAVRDAASAVEMGERAARLTQHRDPFVLDALAAAYAEAGRFEEAVDVAAQAKAEATRSGQTALAEKIEARRRRYQRGEAYRMQSVDLRPLGGSG